MKYVNPFRRMIEEKGYVIGVSVSTRDPVITELLGSLFDFVWYDMEHTWISHGEVLDGMIACRASGAATMVRIPWNDPVLAKPVLDMGTDAIVFPQIRSVQEAKNAIAACSYPPDGVRGYAPVRAAGYGALSTQQYAEEAKERVFKILQVESRECIDALDDILELEGIDCISAGPMDLTADLGKLGRLRDPEVLAAFDRIGEITRRHNVPLMIPYGFSEQEIEEWKERGARIFLINDERGLMRMEALRELEITHQILGMVDAK